MQNYNNKSKRRRIAQGLIGLVASLIGIYQFLGGPGIPLLTRIGSAASSTSGAEGSAFTIIYHNTLTAPTSEWGTDENCFFASDGFHVKPNLACPSPVGQGDVDVSVQMRQISGASTDLNGVEVRRSGSPASLYEFDIATTGRWQFKLCLGGFDNCRILGGDTNSAIYTESGAVNTVEVRAVGSHFTLLVNGKQVGQANDSSLTSGNVWLDTGGISECVFTNFTAAVPA